MSRFHIALLVGGLAIAIPTIVGLFLLRIIRSVFRAHPDCFEVYCEAPCGCYADGDPGDAPEERFAYASDGTERVDQERWKQVMLHFYGPKQDDRHTQGELAIAAQAYIVAGLGGLQAETEALLLWPFDRDSFHPKLDAIRNFEKAGGLIAAEIDRRLRLRSVN